jgi:hypothetical protein
MPKRSSKPRDLNEMASAIVEEATAEAPATPDIESKNPHAVALGRMGGIRGGKARDQRA